jgi:hypothetical protein
LATAGKRFPSGTACGRASRPSRYLRRRLAPQLWSGAFIYAGLDGTRRSLGPGEPLLVDSPTLDSAERERLTVVRLPGSLTAALDALAADPLLMSALQRSRDLLERLALEPPLASGGRPPYS